MSSKMTREEAERLRAAYRAQMTKNSRAKATLPASPSTRPKKTTQNPETAILKAIVDTLQLRVPGLVLWRNNSGATRTQSGGFVRFGAVGSADLLGVLAPEGRLVALEVKQPGKKPTSAQVSWLASVRTAGAIAGVVTSPEEALALLQEAGAKVLIPARPGTGPHAMQPATNPNKATAPTPGQDAPSLAVSRALVAPPAPQAKATRAGLAATHKANDTAPSATAKPPKAATKAAAPNEVEKLSPPTTRAENTSSTAPKPSAETGAPTPTKAAPKQKDTTPAKKEAAPSVPTKAAPAKKEAAPLDKKGDAAKASPPKAAKNAAPQQNGPATPPASKAEKIAKPRATTEENPAPTKTPAKAARRKGTPKPTK